MPRLVPCLLAATLLLSAQLPAAGVEPPAHRAGGAAAGVEPPAHRAGGAAAGVEPPAHRAGGVGGGTAAAYYLRGRALLDAGEPAAAAIALCRAAESAAAGGAGEGTPPLDAVARFHAARAFQQAGDLARATNLFAIVSADVSPLPAAYRARAAFLRAEALETIAPDLCDEAYKDVVLRFPESSDAPYAILRLAAHAFERHDYEGAQKRYSDIVGYPSVASNPDLLCAALIGAGASAASAFDDEAALGFFSRAADIDTPRAAQAAYLRVNTLYRLNREGEATDACQEILESTPDSPWIPDVTLWLGTCLYNHQQYAEAAPVLLGFATRWPSRTEAPQALLAASHAFLADSRLDEAFDAAALLIATYPSSPLVPEAHALRGEALLRQLRFGEARLVFDDLIRARPGTPQADRATLLKGRCLFALGAEDPARYADAASCFRSLLESPNTPTPELREELLTRIARCQELSGNPPSP